jgi:hypothetical protein
MANVQRLWTIEPASGYTMPVALDFDHYKELDYQSLNKKALASNWKTLALTWSSIKKKDKKPDIATLYVLSELCFRKLVMTGLFPKSTSELEFLPARLYDEDWVLLNCLRVTRAIDVASSDLQWVKDPDSPPRIWRMHWINVVDQRAHEKDVFCIPVSSDPSSFRNLLVTDLFVDRVHTLGLHGLEFKHIGYIVPDSSQAVPKPLSPPTPPPKPSKRKPPKLTSSPLPADERIEIAEVGAQWWQRLQLPSHVSPQSVLQRVTEEMQRLRPVFWTISADERIDASLGLSAIYGDLLCSACGWSWAELRESRNKRWVAVLAPSGNHALALVPYVQQQIQSEAPTVALLFNLIVAGDLPPTEPGQLMTIG